MPKQAEAGYSRRCGISGTCDTTIDNGKDFKQPVDILNQSVFRGSQMSEPGSITRIIFSLKDGDAEAVQAIWRRYYQRLVQVARDKLRTSLRRVADEEDVAQSAFFSFYRGIKAGRFPVLNDREGLWKLLFVITARKAADQLQHEHRKKRAATMTEMEDIEQIIGDEPTPEFAIQIIEQYEQLLEKLGDESLRRVAVLKMEGYSHDEIAELLECSRRTVARKLAGIRFIWEQERTQWTH
jgi:RNA polymerase sigma factor (sigma-70 family)